MTHMLLVRKANKNRGSLGKQKQLGNCAEELDDLTFFFFFSCIFCSVWTNIALVCGETKGDPKRKTMDAPYNDKRQLKKRDFSLKSRPGNMILQIINIY